MSSAVVHVTASDLRFTGSYEPTGDVLYLSAAEDDKCCAAQETGHAVRSGTDGQVTHVTLINARWLVDRDGELVATLRHGRQLRLLAPDLVSLLG